MPRVINSLFWKKTLIFLGLAGCVGIGGVAHVAQAQEASRYCVPAQTLQRNAAQSYLIRLTEIGQVPVDGRSFPNTRIDTRGARFEVLKIYSGDVQAISVIGNAMLVVHCSQEWNFQCNVLGEDNYPFHVGQMFVLYDKPDENGSVTIRLGPCPGSKRFINSEQELAEFESLYPPIWVSAVWENEHREVSAQGVSEQQENVENSSDAQAGLQEQGSQASLDVQEVNVDIR